MRKGNAVEKKNPGDLTREELIAALRWPRRTFDVTFRKFCGFYRFNEEDFCVGYSTRPNPRQSSGKSKKKLFRQEWKNILLILLKAFPNNPDYRANAKDDAGEYLSRVSAYNDELLTLVDKELGDYERRIVKNSAVYLSAVAEAKALPVLGAKLRELVAAARSFPPVVRLHLWRELFAALDRCICSAFTLDHRRKAQFENNSSFIIGFDTKRSVPPEFFEKARAVRKRLEESEVGSLDGLLAAKLKERMQAIEVKDKAGNEGPDAYRELSDMCRGASAEPDNPILSPDALREMIESRLAEAAAALDEEVTLKEERAKRPFSDVETCEEFARKELAGGRPGGVDAGLMKAFLSFAKHKRGQAAKASPASSLEEPLIKSFGLGKKAPKGRTLTPAKGSKPALG